jgi:ferredoxin-NADP reductase
VSIFKSRLTRREEVAEGTMSFHFEKPPGFQFKAGQFIDLTLLNPLEVDSEGTLRTLSMASAPFETELMFATRMRDTAFKRVLKTLPPNSEVTLEGPMGSLTLHNNPKKPAVFLAGGIGITPFLSMILQATHERLPHSLSLFYSNRRPEDASFMNLLSGAQQANQNFRFVPTMTKMENSQSGWNGEIGVINREMLARHLPGLQGPIYYIAGPPALVAAMRQMLIEAGVDEDDIRSEEFGGY